MKKLKQTGILLLMALLLCGCGGLGDWSYDLLPGDYEIWRVNSQTIVLGTRNGSTLEHAVDSYISAFSHNEEFIAVQRLNMDGMEIAAGTDIRSLDLESEYWLVDASTQTTYGPYTAEEYRTQLSALDVGPLGDWIDTIPAPAGAQ